MAHRSPSRLCALHVLRLKGFAGDDVVAARCGVDVDAAAALLGAAADEGLAVRREGRLAGWSLTPDGRSMHEKLLAADLDDAGARATVDDAYRRFLALNHDMLECCTHWQLRTVDGTQVPNDHSDADHDRGAIAKLGAIDDAVQPICADLAAAMDRFADYGPRLRRARAKVDGGDRDWFTKPLIDSYHTVWFELHEDLLATLGIERSKEG